MAILEKFEFERSRGIVWVCDLASSSKYLNDNQTADELEKFLPKLYWTASMAVDAAGGKFIKWTGDGFMAWFETPLHRMLGEKAATVFDAAWYLTLLINVTQLGLKPKRKFKIRHGIAYEQDALLIKISRVGGYESLDLVGRAVVLAFRLSEIQAEFPNIVTQKELVVASAAFDQGHRKFLKWQVSADDKLKYFKGERWGTDAVYVSSDKVRRAKNTKSLLKQAQAAIDLAEGRRSPSDERIRFVMSFLKNMEAGPDWCREVLDEYTHFLREGLLGSLKGVVPILKKLNQTHDPNKNGAA
jgi:class 3 adenylate cyclase